MQKTPVTVIETPSFLRDAKRLADDKERKEIILFLAHNPNAGDIWKGTGGLRKIRYAREGSGKSGGFRVIYFLHFAEIPLFAMNVFAKNEKNNITQADRNELKDLSALLVKTYKGDTP